MTSHGRQNSRRSRHKRMDSLSAQDAEYEARNVRYSASPTPGNSASKHHRRNSIIKAMEARKHFNLETFAQQQQKLNIKFTDDSMNHLMDKSADNTNYSKPRKKYIINATEHIPQKIQINAYSPIKPKTQKRSINTKYTKPASAPPAARRRQQPHFKNTNNVPIPIGNIPASSPQPLPYTNTRNKHKNQFKPHQTQKSHQNPNVVSNSITISISNKSKPKQKPKPKPAVSPHRGRHRHRNRNPARNRSGPRTGPRTINSTTIAIPISNANPSSSPIPYKKYTKHTSTSSTSSQHNTSVSSISSNKEYTNISFVGFKSSSPDPIATITITPTPAPSPRGNGGNGYSDAVAAPISDPPIAFKRNSSNKPLSQQGPIISLKGQRTDKALDGNKHKSPSLSSISRQNRRPSYYTKPVDVSAAEYGEEFLEMNEEKEMDLEMEFDSSLNLKRKENELKEWELRLTIKENDINSVKAKNTTFIQSLQKQISQLTKQLEEERNSVKFEVYPVIKHISYISIMFIPLLFT